MTEPARSGEALERAFPKEQVWYLEARGFHPWAQRRGVGSALLGAGLANVDADDVACYLHTSDPANVKYYERWGFEAAQPAFRAGSDGPIYFGMTRRAHPVCGPALGTANSPSSARALAPGAH